MRSMFLAAATVAALSGTTHEAKTAAPALAARATSASAPEVNPTGIPSYLCARTG
jgi:hypothetical protein